MGKAGEPYEAYFGYEKPTGVEDDKIAAVASFLRIVI